MADPHSDSDSPPLDEHDTLPPDQDPAVGDGVEEPPRDVFGILKRLGPGLIIAGSIVGSGELIATTKTGAQAGIMLLWLIIIGCLIKVFVQIELGRYTIGHGETTLAALDQVPGPRFRVNWILWFWLAMMLLGIGQLGGIVGGVGQAAALAIPIRGDYAEATRYPSANEIKTYLKWDDAILSEWDLTRLDYSPNAIDVSRSLLLSRHDYDGAAQVEWVDKASRRTLQQMEWIKKFDGTLHAKLKKHGPLLIKGSELLLQTSVYEELKSDLHSANGLLLKKAAEGEIKDEKLSEFAKKKEIERNRILRGHSILANRMRLQETVDFEANRIVQAVAAVAELAERESRLKAINEKKSDQLTINVAQARVDEQKKVIATILDPPTWDDKIWAAFFALITAMLLYRGRYATIQSIATVLVVAFTFITIGNVISLQMTEQWHISFSQIIDGLSFELPEASDGITPLATALATFGIIGVGASELIAYPYWCLEKGYAKFTGKRDDSEDWARRARGWMNVMRWDAFASMVVYTVATIAFFLMGVAVLYNEGRDPDGMRMVSTLATAYVPVFGAYARWLFLGGAVAVLYSTFLVATAGNARMYTDALKIYGLMDHNNQTYHDRALSAFSVILPFLCLAVFCSGINPVRAILISGAMQALLLPMIGFGALYFRYTRTDGRIKPGPIWDVALIVSFIGLFIAGSYGAYKQIIKFF